MAAVMMVGAFCSPARANMVIVPTFGPNLAADTLANRTAIENTINSAILFYESTFLDPITVNINFDETASAASFLGQSTVSPVQIAYSAYHTLLTSDATSSNDITALSHLPNVATAPVGGSSTMQITTANAKAVGFISGSDPTSDGSILFNTKLTSPGTTGSTLQYNLLPVVFHEIDEVLGFNSGLDPGNQNIFPGDLFRYDGSGGRSYDTNTSTTAFFSIDTTTNLSQFNNSGSGDFNDWVNSPQPRVQDAVATPGANPPLGVELIYLDVTGYDLATPEPGTMVTMLSALAAGFFVKRRRDTSKGQTGA